MIQFLSKLETLYHVIALITGSCQRLAHMLRHDAFCLFLAGHPVLLAGWEENSSTMFTSPPLRLESRRGSSGGLPPHGFLKNSSRTGAHGIVLTSSSLVPPGLLLPWVAFSDPELPFLGNEVSLWGVNVPSCPTSEYVAGSGFCAYIQGIRVPCIIWLIQVIIV